MNFNYKMTSKDEKIFLNEKHKNTNKTYFILFAIIYLVLNIKLLIKNFLVFILIYIMYIIILVLLLYICNYIFTIIELKIRQKRRKENYETYHFSITNRGITQSKDSFKIEVLWKNVKKVKIRKNYIFIEPKNNIAFLFRKEEVKDYEKLLKIMNENRKD